MCSLYNHSPNLGRKTGIWIPPRMKTSGMSITTDHHECPKGLLDNTIFLAKLDI